MSPITYMYYWWWLSSLSTQPAQSCCNAWTVILQMHYVCGGRLPTVTRFIGTCYATRQRDTYRHVTLMSPKSAENRPKQETQISLTNRATNVCKRNGTADLLKYVHPHIYYHAKFGSSALKYVGINRAKNWGKLELRSLGVGGVADPKIYAPTRHVKFGSSATKGICINRREPQNWGALGPRPLGVGVADHVQTKPFPVCVIMWNIIYGTSAPKVSAQIKGNPKIGPLGPRPLAVWASLTHRNTPLPTCVILANCRSTSNGTSVIKEIRLKIRFLASRLSRSLKVIGTDTDRSITYDFLLTFYSNYGPILYRFRDKRLFQSKIAKFSHPCVFCAPAEGVPLGIES